MYEVYFSYSITKPFEKLGKFNTEEEADECIDNYLENKLKYKPYYFNVWGDCKSDTGKVIDYGSHTEFFVVKCI